MEKPKFKQGDLVHVPHGKVMRFMTAEGDTAICEQDGKAVKVKLADLKPFRRHAMRMTYR